MPWSDGTRCHDLRFLNVELFKSTFLLSSFTFIKRLFSSSLLSAIMLVSSAYLKSFIFLLAILILAYTTLNFSKTCVCFFLSLVVTILLFNKLYMVLIYFLCLQVKVTQTYQLKPGKKEKCFLTHLYAILFTKNKKYKLSTKVP